MLISFVVPCYNDAHHLPRSIGSLLKLNIPAGSEIEIILVDDGSSSSVENLWGSKVRLIRHHGNMGLSQALNTGIQNSNGEFYAILASDDELHESYLEKCIEFTSSADVISSDFQVNGVRVRCRSGDLEILKQANCHGYAALVRKSAWEVTGGFKSAMNPSWEDYEHFFNLAKNGFKWHHVPIPLHIYHRNPNGRDAIAQGKGRLLRSKLEGYHQDIFGNGKGIVAFIIPCYKHEKFVVNAVNAALCQVYPHIRVVVVDDGSPGNILEAMKDVDDSTGRVLVFRQDNKHLSGARNAGIKVALNYWDPEYIVPLDADDEVDPKFVEVLMGELNYTDKRYIYTDLKFIGDAWHEYKVQDFDCHVLVNKHLHACTVLMPMQMLRDIYAMRGYFYDEGMKKGYEDWEFLLAAVEAGWCGKRIPMPLFFYRFHNEGSMRTEARDINDNLVTYIKRKHPWITREQEVAMGCSSCGGSRSMKVMQRKGSGSIVYIPSLGSEIDSNTMLAVRYTGGTSSTITKIGNGGVIYKYSSDINSSFGPSFNIFARDAHLFVGKFEIQLIPSQLVSQ